MDNPYLYTDIQPVFESGHTKVRYLIQMWDGYQYLTQPERITTTHIHSSARRRLGAIRRRARGNRLA
jgi:hypothetical protein